MRRVNVDECDVREFHEKLMRRSRKLGEDHERCECRECFSNTYAYAWTCAFAIVEPKTHSPHSQSSPKPDDLRVWRHASAGECLTEHSPIAEGDGR